MPGCRILRARCTEPGVRRCRPSLPRHRRRTRSGCRRASGTARGPSRLRAPDQACALEHRRGSLMVCVGCFNFGIPFAAACIMRASNPNRAHWWPDNPHLTGVFTWHGRHVFYVGSFGHAWTRVYETLRHARPRCAPLATCTGSSSGWTWSSRRSTARIITSSSRSWIWKRQHHE